MELEQQIGYLVAKVEELAQDQRAMSVKLDQLEEKVNDKIRTAEAIFRVLRWTFAGLIAVLTLPVGQIMSFVKKILGIG